MFLKANRSQFKKNYNRTAAEVSRVQVRENDKIQVHVGIEDEKFHFYGAKTENVYKSLPTKLKMLKQVQKFLLNKWKLQLWLKRLCIMLILINPDFVIYV